jgi:protein-tyrosine phosphatase
MLNFQIVSELDVATYVMANIPSWLPSSDLPLRGGPIKEVKIQCLLGDQLVIDEFSQELRKGFSYSYPATMKVQGITPVTDCPYLFATMAPDQYIVAQAMSLSDEDFQSIEGLSLDKFQIETLKRIKFTCLDDDTYLQFRSAVPDMSEQALSKIVQKIQALIGDQHIRAIAHEISSLNKYNAITLTEHRLAETAGFDIPQNVHQFTVSVQSLDSVNATINGDKAKIERVKIYKDHHPCLIEHMVIQSDRAIANDEEHNYRLALDVTDMPLLVSFFDRTIGKGLPVVINCTDGVDRTGILIVAYTMLYLSMQNDFTKLSEMEQKKFMMNLIGKLRLDRGPYFLRQEADIARAVMLGYTLIATKKSMNDEYSSVLVEKRDSLCRDFSLVNEDFKESYINILKNKMVNSKAYKAKRYPIMEAPIEVYNALVKKGLDIGLYEKNNKNIYRFAVNTFLSNPCVKNLIALKELLNLGGQYARSSMCLELVELSYPINFINYLIKIFDDERNKKQIKEEIKNEMSKLSNTERTAYKDNFKTKIAGLKTKANTKEHKDEAMLKLLARMKATLPSSSKSYKSDDKDTLTSSLDSFLSTPSHSSSLSSGYSSDNVPSSPGFFSFSASRSPSLVSTFEKLEIIDEQSEIVLKLKRSSSLEDVKTKDKKKTKTHKEKTKRNSFSGF